MYAPRWLRRACTALVLLVTCTVTLAPLALVLVPAAVWLARRWHLRCHRRFRGRTLFLIILLPALIDRELSPITYWAILHGGELRWRPPSGLDLYLLPWTLLTATLTTIPIAAAYWFLLYRTPTDAD